MNAESKIGTQIEAFCTKCKEDTIHVITAMDGSLVSKVMCERCNSYHKYKSAQSSQAAGTKTKTSRSKTTAAKTTKKTKTTRTRRTSAASKGDWSTMIGDVDTDKAVVYNLKENYQDIDLIDHKKFGLGIVQKIHSETKIEVLFEDGVKMLVQNWLE